MDDATSLLALFFANDVDRLSNTHYSDYGEGCDICKKVDVADYSDNDAGISLKAVVKTKTCGHVFHKVCLHAWLETQVQPNHSGACPKCRQVLITSNEDSDQDLDEDLDRVRISFGLDDSDLELVVRGPDLDGLSRALLPGDY